MPGGGEVRLTIGRRFQEAGQRTSRTSAAPPPSPKETGTRPQIAKEVKLLRLLLYLQDDIRERSQLTQSPIQFRRCFSYDNQVNLSSVRSVRRIIDRKR